MTSAQDVESIRLSLVELRRLFQRKELVALWERAFGRASNMDYGELRLLDAVRISEDGRATVGEIAARLGVDPSGASRQVADAVRKGLLRRQADQGDGRRVALELTPKGTRLQEKGSLLTSARITLALEDWSAADRARFAELFGRFVTSMIATPRRR